MKNNLPILLMSLLLGMQMNTAFSNSSFLTTYTQSNGSGTDVGNAITADGAGNFYVTGSHGNNLMVKKFNASMTPDASWNPSLTYPGVVGQDIDFYNNDLYIIANDVQGFHLIKLNVITQAVVATSFSISSDVTNAPRGYSGTVNSDGWTIVGSFNIDLDFNGAISINDNLNGNSTANLFVGKFNHNLVDLWLQYIPSSHDAIGYSISTVEIAGGAYFSYLTGYYAKGNATPGSQTITFPGNATLATAGGNDIFIAKFMNSSSAPSTYTWSRSAGGSLAQSISSKLDRGYAICATGSGDSYITGAFKGSATFGGTSVSCTGSTTQFGFVARYNNSGTCVWSRVFGGCTTTNGAEGRGIYVNSGVYVTGTTDYLNSFGLGIFVGRYSNSTGSMLYESVAKNLNNGSFRSGYGITGSTCDIYVAGSYSNNVRFGLANSQTLNAGSQDYFVSRLAAHGNVKFNTPDCSAGPHTMQATGGGTYSWSTGATTSSITIAPITVETSYNVSVTSGSCPRTIPFTVHPSYAANAGPDRDLACPVPPPCPTLGTVLPGNPTYSWTPSTGLSCTNCATPAACSTGVFQVAVTYANCPSTIDNVLVYYGVGCRQGVIERPEFELTIVPNPNNGLFSIGNVPNGVVLSIYDSYGRIVRTLKHENENTIIDISNVAKGIYFITDGNQVRSKILVD